MNQTQIVKFGSLRRAPDVNACASTSLGTGSLTEETLLERAVN
jgi:hypothetical protein